MIAKNLKTFKTENCELTPEKLGTMEPDPYTEVNYRTARRQFCEMTMEKANHDHKMHLLRYVRETKGYVNTTLQGFA